MNLRRKTLLSMSLLMAVMIIMLALISYNFVIRAALDHEKMDVNVDVERAHASIRAMEEQLSVTATDWAVWNDTYVYMGDLNQDFADDNLGYTTCDSLDLDYFLLFNNSCGLVYGMAYDSDSGMPLVLCDEIKDVIINNVRCLDIDDPGDVVEGLIADGHGVLMVSVHPVTDNSLEATNGFLVIGRYIDERKANEISHTIKLETTLLSVNDRSSTSLDQGSWNEMMENGTTAIVPVDNKIILGYRALIGINGSAVGVIEVQSDRDILAQANSSMTVIHTMVVLTSLVFCSAAIVLTDNFTTRRLDRLSKQVNDIGKSGDMTRRIEMDGSDELTHLADELNRAMSTIMVMSKALSDSEKRYHAVVNDQTEMIFRIDDRGTILFANDAFINLIGSNKEIDGRNLRELVPEDEYHTLMEKCRESMTAGSAVAIDQQLSGGAGGHDRWIAWRIRHVPTDESVGVFQCVGRDLTSQKEAEIALAAANKKLNMLASVTRHDVINKLTVAHGFVSIARKKVDDQRCADQLAKAEDALGAIEGYLEFTRNYQGMGMVAPVWIDLEDAISKAAESPRDEGVEVTSNVGDLEMLADPLVEKVFCNLMDNSLRHGERVTHIDVTARAVDDHLLLTFEDDGVGVQENEKELIFEAGYGKHTGYGLFLAREILGSSGMTIMETGRSGHGARFEISVPAGRYRHAALAASP